MDASQFSIMPATQGDRAQVESPVYPHPDFTARRERMMREDEEDVTWNDNRTLEDDE